MQVGPEYSKQDIKANRIIFLIFFLIFGLPILWLVIKDVNYSPESSSDATTPQASIAADTGNREDVISKFAPKYCANHQNTIVTGATDLPNNDGSGWTDEECKEIIGALYDMDNRESAIQAVVDKKIAVGLSVVHLAYSWGNPQDINRTVTSSRERQQWVYPGYNYVYVEDGKITSYQT